jgi:hypothetical protein
MLDEAIRWVEDKGTIRRLDKGADQNPYSSQFETAAVEMRVLRRLLADSEFIGANRICPTCAEDFRFVSLNYSSGVLLDIPANSN